MDRAASHTTDLDLFARELKRLDYYRLHDEDTIREGDLIVAQTDAIKPGVVPYPIVVHSVIPSMETLLEKRAVIGMSVAAMCMRSGADHLSFWRKKAIISLPL